MPEEQKRRALKPVLLPCPRCGQDEASISVNLNRLDDDAFTCNDCEAEFGVGEMFDIVRAWVPLLKWLEAVPGQE